MIKVFKKEQEKLWGDLHTNLQENNRKINEKMSKNEKKLKRFKYHIF